MAIGAGRIRAGSAYVELMLDDKKFTSGLARAQQRMRRLGTALTAVGLAIGAAIGVTTRIFMSFDDAMRKTKAVSGATAAEFEQLTDKAKTLGRTTSFTASQVANAMAELGRAGFKPKEIDAAIAGILDLARATDTELPRAAEIAANALRGFGLEAGQIGQVADLLAATANKSAQRLDDIGEALKMVAPLARDAGEPIEKVAAALGILANAGIKGTMAGTAIARAFKNLSNEAKRKALKEVGVDAVDAAGNLRPLADILADLGRAVKGMGSAQRLSIFESLFGRGMAAASALAQNAEKLKGFGLELRDVAGYARETAKEMDAGLGGAYRRMMSAAEGAALAIGDALAGKLEDAGKAITEAATSVAEFIERNRELVITVAKTAAVIMAVGIAAHVVSGIISGWRMGFMVVVPVLKHIAVSFANVAAASTAASIGVKSYAASLGNVVTVAAGVVAGIVAVGYAVGRALDAMREHTAELNDEQERYLQEVRKAEVEDKKKIARLEELKKRQTLTSGEMNEAARIIADLKGRYRDLNIELDRTNGKIGELGDATAKMNAQLAGNMKRALEGVIGEAKNNLAELRKEMASIREPGWGWRDLIPGVGYHTAATADAQLRKIQDVREKIQKEWTRINEASRKLAELRQREKLGSAAARGPAGSGAAAAARAAADEEAARRAQVAAENRARYEEERDRMRLEELERTDRQREQIRRLEIEAGPDSEYEMSKKLLALERDLAIQQAVRNLADKERLDLIRKEYALRLKMVDAREAERKAAEWQDDLRDLAGLDEEKEQTQQGIADAVARVRDLVGRAGGTRGSFAAAALRGFGATDASERIADATEETAKEVKRIRKEAQNGLAFA